MSIRSTHIIDDIQQCIYALLNTLSGSTSPWTSWTVVLGYPESEVFDQFTEPIIYVMAPVQIDKVEQQGQDAPTRYWRLTIGVWLERKHGGPEELNIIASRIMDLFEDKKVVGVDTTFNVTLGSTSYTSTNLSTQGIYVNGIIGDRERLEFIDEKEFRHEWEIGLFA